MKKLNQTGVAHLIAILIVIVVGIVGFTGWKVYDSQKGTKQSLDNSNKSDIVKSESKKAEVKKDEPKIPDGFAVYENKEFGFKFAYPKEWGKVTIKDTRYGGDQDKGKRWGLVFDGNKNITAGLTSKDWVPAGGRGGACTVADGSDYQSLPSPQPTNQATFVQKILAKSSNYYLTEWAENGYCSNIALRIDYIYANNPTYLTLRILYNVHDFKVESQETEFNQYVTDPSKFISADLVDTMKKVASSIQDLN